MVTYLCPHSHSILHALNWICVCGRRHIILPVSQNASSDQPGFLIILYKTLKDIGRLGMRLEQTYIISAAYHWFRQPKYNNIIVSMQQNWMLRAAPSLFHSLLRVHAGVDAQMRLRAQQWQAMSTARSPCLSIILSATWPMNTIAHLYSPTALH